MLNLEAEERRYARRKRYYNCSSCRIDSIPALISELHQYRKALELACAELVNQEKQFYGTVHSRLIINPGYWLGQAKKELESEY